jgi:hypothetical protein
MKYRTVVLSVLLLTTGCGLTNPANTNNGSNSSSSLATANGTYWKSNALATSLYQLALTLNSNGTGQCSFYSYTQWYGPYDITWTYSGGNLALANGTNCLAPIIGGIQTTGNPALAFSGTLEDGSNQYPLDFSLMTGSIP